jgi:hypothetical protein
MLHPDPAQCKRILDGTVHAKIQCDCGFIAGFLDESPELRRRLGTAGLELARKELAFDQKMELLIASYRKAIARG